MFLKNKKPFFIVIIIILIAIGSFFGYQKIKAKNNQPQYITSRVEKTTVVSSVSASGTIQSSNYHDVKTNTSGIVKTVFVKDGDEVKKGAKLLEIELDSDGLQAQSKAYSSYLAAQNSVNDARISKLSLESSLAQANISVTGSEQTKLSLKRSLENAQASLKQAEIDYAITKEKYNSGELSWSYLEKDRLSLKAAQDALKLAQEQYNTQDVAIDKAKQDLNIAQEKLNNADAVIKKVETDLWSASLAYNQTKSLITSPISGKVSGLNVFAGMNIAGGNSSSGNSSSANSTSTTSGNSLMAISNQTNPMASVNISESDIAKIKIGQKATITLDALADKNFTGQVITINKLGTVSSGVTNYPAIIQFDTLPDDVLPNMSATANIVLDTKTDVLAVPTSAVTTSNGESTVRVLINGQPQTKTIQTGLSSDTQIEITSGLNEGEEVITSTVNPTSTTSSNGTSIFSGSGMRTGTGGLGSSGNQSIRTRNGN